MPPEKFEILHALRCSTETSAELQSASAELQTNESSVTIHDHSSQHSDTENGLSESTISILMQSLKLLLLSTSKID